MIQHLVRTIFTKLNVPFTLAKNGAEALKYASAETFGLILLDVNMPERNGYDVLEEIRGVAGHKNSETPAIVITATENEAQSARFKASDFQGALQKPFSLSDVKRMLELYMDE